MILSVEVQTMLYCSSKMGILAKNVFNWFVSKMIIMFMENGCFYQQMSMLFYMFFMFRKNCLCFTI